MGFNVAWVAVRGKGRDAVLRELGLRGTGESDQEAEAEACGLKLAGGWYLVHMNGGGHDVAPRLQDGGLLREVSRGAEAVFCAVAEHVMYFETSYWREGTQVWRVEHDGGGFHASFLGKEGVGGVRHLDVSGTPPPEFQGIRDRCFAEQDAGDREQDQVDYVSDIPVELAAVVTGFRHDFVSPEPFEILEPTGERRATGAQERRGCVLALPAALVFGLERVLSRRSGR
jgi:hypothetical protein